MRLIPLLVFQIFDCSATLGNALLYAHIYHLHFGGFVSLAPLILFVFHLVE